jgi:3-oxoacyl-[acyl-carrier protein] reductase
MPPSPYFDLTGRKAMVVGAEHPAGAAIARAYAEAGADVALCTLAGDDGARAPRVSETIARAPGDCRHGLKREIEAMGRVATQRVVDVTLGGSVQATMREIVNELDGLDIVASAPDLFLAKPIDRTTDTELARVLAVNFTAQFFVVRSAAEEFRRLKRGGRIALVTSVLGERSMLDVAAYASAHGAVHNLVRAAAHELAAEGITLNAISLGWMDWMDDRIDRDDENGQRALRFPMLRRTGKPDEIGPLAVWLASERGAAYFTGQIFSVDGGLLQHQ